MGSGKQGGMRPKARAIFILAKAHAEAGAPNRLIELAKVARWWKQLNIRSP